MINELHALLHRPEKGWDPVTPGYADEYARYVWGKQREIQQEVDQVEAAVGALRDKRVLDLGGGPGQYTCAFAQRGARVTWRDVSRSYRDIVAAKAAELGLRLDLSLGYMEEATASSDEPYDLVFSRVCWSYCRNDPAFRDMVLDLVRPAGAAYIVFCTRSYDKAPTLARRFAYVLYDRLGLKIGHLHPTPHRMASLFARRTPRRLQMDLSDPEIAHLIINK